MQKTALITGCSSGIGMLSAIDLAKAGFKVYATMRDPSRSTKLMQLAGEAGIVERITVSRLDITEFNSLPAIVANLTRNGERIDVLVNNAGYALGGFAEDIQLDELRAQFDTNFFGHVALTRAVLPIMRGQEKVNGAAGHIIMVSSISGLVSNPVTSSYSASKHALEGWTESLRVEVRSLGIKVVLVEPGAYDTEIREKNIRIGRVALTGESPNRERARRFSVVKTKLKKGDAREVSRLITRIAQNPNPGLRYLIGKDAHLFYWSQRLLPWKIYEKLLAKMSKID